jgi:hypothetical protein
MIRSDSKKSGIELRPDAWQRFERAVDVVAKSPPQHRTKIKPKGKQSKSPAGSKRHSRAKE